MRYIWNYSSNAFSKSSGTCSRLIFLFGAGYTLMRNEHVRIDLISGRFSKRARRWIDIFGILFFLMPMAIAIMALSWPVFVLALPVR
jgi:TRAP-type mannitol/chloroaromatic compound transport system permease small subunit